MGLSVLGLVVVLACAAAGVRADVLIMKDVTLGFGQALENCREESQLTEEMMEQFFDFWREEFRFDQRELGCALHCMSRSFDLLTDAHRMHRQRTLQFIHSFPNGEVIGAQLVEIIHECEGQFEGEADVCWRVLRTAECFQRACRARGLAPAAELMLAELIMEAEPSAAASAPL